MVYALSHEQEDNLRSVIDGSQHAGIYNGEASTMVYRGAQLGDRLSMAYARLNWRLFMAGNRASMTMRARRSKGSTVIPWGLAGGLRGAALAWPYLAVNFHDGVPPNQEPDKIHSCAAALAGVKIGNEQPGGMWNSMGTDGCEYLSSKYCSATALNPSERQNAEKQADDWYSEYAEAHDKALAEQRARRERALPQVRADIAVWQEEAAAKGKKKK